MTQSIVLVEDDLALNQMITEFLTDEGYSVTPVTDGAEAKNTILSCDPDLVILDIMLPNIDGIEICRQLRATYTKPIMMLTAKDDDFVEVASLQQGADTYLTKPIRPHVLLAHIQAVLRRQQPVVDVPSKGLTVQGLVLDQESMSVSHNNQAIEVTTGEFEILMVLMEYAGTPVSRDRLYQLTRKIEYDGLDRSVDLHISNLRKKLKDGTPPYRYIKTVRGKGYLMSKR